jgi:hypothetical protein
MRNRGTETIAAEDSKMKFVGEVRDNVFQGGVRKKPAVLEYFRLCAVILLLSVT